MSDLVIAPVIGTRKEQYELLLPQLEALVAGEEDNIANMANLSSALYFGMSFFWVGFYLVKNDTLVLGPFHGPTACTRISKKRGVCGTAWHEKKVQIVPNVDLFPGHIACSSESKSEIVLPIFNAENEVVAVLDVDSKRLNDFDNLDEYYLQQILNKLRF